MKNTYARIGLATIVIAAVTGCNEQKIDAKGCWSPEAKSSFLSLARGGVLKAMTTDALTENGKGRSAAQIREFFDKGLTVTADTYHITGGDSKVGSLNCGANLSMQFERPDGKKFTAKSVPTNFQIFKAEEGLVYSIDNGFSFARLITELNAE